MPSMPSPNWPRCRPRPAWTCWPALRIGRQATSREHAPGAVGARGDLAPVHDVVPGAGRARRRGVDRWPAPSLAAARGLAGADRRLAWRALPGRLLRPGTGRDQQAAPADSVRPAEPEPGPGLRLRLLHPAG